MVDQQFKDDINRRLEEQGDGLDELKEQIDDLKKEVGHLRNDMTAKLANDSININAAAKKASVADGGVKAGGGTGVSLEKIKAIEEEIKNMKAKFTKEIESIKTTQAISAGPAEGSGGGDSGAAAAALQNTIKKIEE